MRSGLLGGGGSGGGSGRTLILLWQRLKASQQMLGGMVAGLCLASIYYSLIVDGRLGRRGPGASSKGTGTAWDTSMAPLYGSTSQPRTDITRVSTTHTWGGVSGPLACEAEALWWCGGVGDDGCGGSSVVRAIRR